MSNQLIVVVDADAIIAQLNSADFHHKKAMKIAEHLVSSKAKVIYPATAIVEAVTFIQRVLSNSAAAYETFELLTGGQAKIIEVNQNTLSQASNYFSPRTSKKNTMFDCIVAAIAEEYKADAIFSFDQFYKKNGFKLAAQVISTSQSPVQ
jgi:predicted nucleic acid-binding protein